MLVNFGISQLLVQKLLDDSPSGMKDNCFLMYRRNLQHSIYNRILTLIIYIYTHILYHFLPASPPLSPSRERKLVTVPTVLKV